MYARSCLTRCKPMDCSTPGSSVLGLLQEILLELGAISFFSRLISILILINIFGFIFMIEFALFFIVHVKNG